MNEVAFVALVCSYLLMDVVVQLVRTSWTKWSRGGAEAARRNAVPVAFPLDHTRPGVHEVVVREEDGFEPRFLPVRAELGAGEVSLREEDGRLRVLVHDDARGMPRRGRRPTALRITAGEWVRWQINQRFIACACTGRWSYQLLTVNVAYGEIGDSRLFLGVPDRFVDERASLF